MIKVTTNDFINKAILIHGDKYNYTISEYINSKTKIKIICPTHGLFEQQSNNHLYGKGCPKCSHNIKLTNDIFIEKAKLIHNNMYNYSLVNYSGIKHKVKIICNKHGMFEQTPDNHLSKKHGCPKCSNNVNLTTEEFIKKSLRTHGDKYNYSLVEYVNSINKVKIICPVHGMFEQKAFNHMRGDKCPSCTKNKRLTKDEFIQKSSRMHGDKYDYSLVEYVNNTKKVIIKCEKHGIFNQAPNNHINGNGCPHCKESKGERKINEILTNNNVKFIRQYKFKDCKYKQPLLFDFYLSDYNICIEYNGRQHYEPVSYFGGEDGFVEIKLRDKIKMEYCNKNNIPLIIFKYDEKFINKLNKLINPKTHRTEFKCCI